jgi:hypothetical protein
MRRYVPVSKIFAPVSAAKTEENVRLTALIVTIKEGMEIINNQMD